MTTSPTGSVESNIATLVHLHHYAFCENGCYKSRRDQWNEGCEARAAQYEGHLKDLVRKARIEELQSMKQAWSDGRNVGGYTMSRIAELEGEDNGI